MVQIDKQRLAQVDFWAKKCRQDMSFCLKQTVPFIDSQIILANRFYAKLAQTKAGKEKIRELKRI